MEPHLDILLVDDDHTDLALFGTAVDKSDLNIWVQNLTSGQQAIDYLEAKAAYTDRSLHPLPDVIVLDLAMAGVNRYDVLAWRKPSPVFSGIPVAVFSNSKDPDEANRVVKLGANRYIFKPMDFEGWKRVIQEIWDFGTQGTAFLRRRLGKTRGSGLGGPKTTDHGRLGAPKRGQRAEDGGRRTADWVEFSGELRREWVTPPDPVTGTCYAHCFLG